MFSTTILRNISKSTLISLSKSNWNLSSYKMFRTSSHFYFASKEDVKVVVAGDDKVWQKWEHFNSLGMALFKGKGYMQAKGAFEKANLAIIKVETPPPDYGVVVGATMLNIANCIRENLKVDLLKNEALYEDRTTRTSKFNVTINEAWNLYEGSAAKVAEVLGPNHRRVGMIKSELVLLLELSEQRSDDVIDAYNEALVVIRSQETDEDNVEQKLQDILHEMNLLNLKNKLLLNKTLLSEANELENEMLECVGKMEEAVTKEEHAAYIITALEKFKLYNKNCGKDTSTVDLMMQSLKGVQHIST